MKRLFVITFFVIIYFCFPLKISAQNAPQCDDRFVTLVNPVRGREHWLDKTLSPLKDQYEDSAKYKNPATWLLQYDALTDDEVVNTIKKFEIKGEVGLFLEVSKKLTDGAGIEYKQNVRWSDPSVVFLSAYKQSERRRLIDLIYKQYVSIFGEYPKSVGAWWIDSYSLQYIKEKYGLDAVMIVADQKTTDSYGVWGQWWGYPYPLSKSNVLVPSKDGNTVVIQWAQRDPVLAYGGDASFSNFSLQANDYVRSGKDTKYFKTLVSTYFDCKNPVGQVTIGMETGMEALFFSGEYKKQLLELNSMKGVEFVTMSEFSKKHNETLKTWSGDIYIGGWTMNFDGRENSDHKERVSYKSGISFKDFFVTDESSFLERDLNKIEPKTRGGPNISLAVVVVFGLITLLRKRMGKIWLSHFAFILASYGLIFNSREQYGWMVYYGIKLSHPYLWQVVIYLVTLGLFIYFLNKYRKKIKNLNLFLFSLPLSFGIDGIFSIIRFTRLSGQYLFGATTFADRITGVLVGDKGVGFINQWFPIKTQAYFYKIPYDSIFLNSYLYLYINPLMHLFMAMLIHKILRSRSKKIKVITLLILCVFYVVFLTIIFSRDPTGAIPLQ